MTGNLCTVLCDKVYSDCFYKKREFKGLTLGQIYFIIKSSQSKIIEDRDFLYRIIVGKSIIEESDDPDSMIYDPMANFDDALSTNFIREDKQNKKMILSMRTATGDPIIDSVYEIIYAKEMPVIESRQKDLKKAIDSSETIPPFVRKMYRELEKGITDVSYFSFNEYMNKVKMYINNRNDYTQDEIEKILTYLILKFIPKDKNDFPSGIVKTDSKKVGNLINKTVKFSDDHPHKWTKKRYDKMLSLSNVYQQFVIFDNFMYLWKMYCLDDIDVEDIQDSDIRLKYLLDQLVLAFSYKYITDYIIFDTKGDMLVLKRFNAIINIIKKIYEQNIIEFSTVDFVNFMLAEQINNQYILKSIDDYQKLKVRMHTQYDRINITSKEVLSYLLEQDLIHSVMLID